MSKFVASHGVLRKSTIPLIPLYMKIFFKRFLSLNLVYHVSDYTKYYSTYARFKDVLPPRCWCGDLGRNID